MRHKVREKQLILVIDDAREIVRGISLRLQAAGYDVVAAYNGEMGLETAIEARPDAIVLDIRMPIMDGLTMLARLREMGEAGAIPTVVVSANIADHARTQALQLGASYFLEKPYEAATLIRAVQSAVNADARAPCALASN